MIKDFMMY
ncbi:hypothetical protein F383_32392 [Gossypium arboreum]|uniref:Uncharacterized protein n=1 Tax=Gossypium arboreum TaxID=29729 RepID=A0A0B0PI20_GOSAR|nr:hypothetical protein F383_32392 [Gossypium arboreum]